MRCSYYSLLASWLLVLLEQSRKEKSPSYCFWLAKIKALEKNATSGSCALAKLTGLLNFQLVLWAKYKFMVENDAQNHKSKLMYSTCPEQQDQISPTLTHWFSQFNITHLLTFKVDASPEQENPHSDCDSRSKRTHRREKTHTHTHFSGMHWDVRNAATAGMKRLMFGSISAHRAKHRQCFQLQMRRREDVQPQSVENTTNTKFNRLCLQLVHWRSNSHAAAALLSKIFFAWTPKK